MGPIRTSKETHDIRVFRQGIDNIYITLVYLIVPRRGIAIDGRVRFRQIADNINAFCSLATCRLF